MYNLTDEPWGILGFTIKGARIWCRHAADGRLTFTSLETQPSLCCGGYFELEGLLRILDDTMAVNVALAA